MPSIFRYTPVTNFSATMGRSQDPAPSLRTRYLQAIDGASAYINNLANPRKFAPFSRALHKKEVLGSYATLDALQINSFTIETDDVPISEFTLHRLDGRIHSIEIDRDELSGHITTIDQDVDIVIETLQGYCALEDIGTIETITSALLTFTATIPLQLVDRYLVIDDEILYSWGQYEESNKTLLRLVRGVNGTTEATHDVGSNVQMAIIDPSIERLTNGIAQAMLDNIEIPAYLSKEVELFTPQLFI